MKSPRDAYTEIFTQYYHTVFNAVFVKVGNSHDAEDICQEVFIALFHNQGKIENVRKWLYGTLRNCVLKFYRDRDPGNADIDAIFNDISLTFVNGFRDTRIIIADALEASIGDETDRDLVELIAYHAFSYRRAGELLGLSKRMTAYRYNRIAKKVVDNLRARGVQNIEDLL